MPKGFIIRLEIFFINPKIMILYWCLILCVLASCIASAGENMQVPCWTNFTGYPSKSESCTRSFCLFTSVFTTAPLSTSLTSSTTLILLAISVLPRINQDSLYIELTPTLETLHSAMRHRDVGMPYHSISEEQRLRRPSKAYSRPTSTPVMIRLFIFMAHFIMFMTLLYYCLYSAVIILL